MHLLFVIDFTDEAPIRHSVAKAALNHYIKLLAEHLQKMELGLMEL